MAQILVIDDDQALRTAMARYLTRKGHEVVTAEDGPTALAAVQDRQFEAVVSDYDMPGMTGAEVWQQLPVDLQQHFILWTGNMAVSSPSGYTVRKGGGASDIQSLLDEVLAAQ